MSTTNPQDLLLGYTHGRSMRYVNESKGLPAAIDTEVEVRDWPVIDPQAREAAARIVLGDDYDWHVEHSSAQWFIDPDRNAAALCVYRPDGPRETDDQTET